MYYIKVSGTVYGPYDDSKIMAFASEGRVVPQSELSNDGQNWFLAGVVPGLFPAGGSFGSSPGMGDNPYATPGSYASEYADGSSEPDLSFWQCYKQCWRRYMVSSGRARRKEYWAWSVFNTIILSVWGMAFAIALSATGGLEENAELTGTQAIILLGFLLPFLVFGLAALTPGINVIVRRLHDMNLSGWFTLLILFPYLNNLFYLLVGIFPGTKGPNGYGRSPKPLN